MVKYEEGWTFIETLIVLSIILVLTSTVGFMAFKYVGKARVVAARTQIENFSMALDTYAMDNSMYPSADQGLGALWTKPILEPVPKNWDGPYLKKKPGRDPWGNDYQYTVPGPHGLPYGIRSVGADGDITSWGN